MDQDTVWLTQKQLADLFGVKKAAISKHVSNIFTSGELDPLATVSKMETVQLEGKRTIVRQVDYYNLDMILSIGYRVNSRRAISFRQWANRVLKEFLIKGYAVRTNMQLQQYEELKRAFFFFFLFLRGWVKKKVLFIDTTYGPKNNQKLNRLQSYK